MIKCTVITSIFKADFFLTTFLNELLLFQEIENIEFLLLHLIPNDNEKEIIKRNFDYRYTKTKYIEISEQEGLYATWNRGITIANGEYIAIWNVDDIRTIAGLKEQIKFLDENQNRALIYGNFYKSKIHAKDNSNPYYVISPNEKKLKFMEGCHLTCFPMWRKNIHNKIGFFDEQFKIAGDFDFQIRVAQKYDFGKTSENLGWYYIADKRKLSSNWECMMTEQTVIGLRYKNFKIIHPLLLIQARLRYVHLTFIFNNERINIDDFKKVYYPIYPINKKYYYLVFNLMRDIWVFIKMKIIKPCYNYAKDYSFLPEKL